MEPFYFLNPKGSQPFCWAPYVKTPFYDTHLIRHSKRENALFQGLIFFERTPKILLFFCPPLKPPVQRVKDRPRAPRRESASRHLLLHGPPGTGKTLFARTLAKESGREIGQFDPQRKYGLFFCFVWGPTKMVVGFPLGFFLDHRQKYSGETPVIALVAYQPGFIHPTWYRNLSIHSIGRDLSGSAPHFVGWLFRGANKKTVYLFVVWGVGYAETKRNTKYCPFCRSKS